MDNINVYILIAALFGVTLWHELGHLVAARWLGVPIVNLTIGLGPILWRQRLGQHAPVQKAEQPSDLVLRAFPLGMSVAVPSRRTAQGTIRRPYSHDLWIAAAGPIASFLLTLFLFAVARWMPMPYDWAYGVVGVGLLSAAIALLNLLPIPGLDGGHLLMVSAARKGCEMTPAQELRLQRAGVKWVVIICLIPLLTSLWTQLVAGLL
jgi:membrane-associated protease RseP (regulator of RpoE activity)